MSFQYDSRLVIANRIKKTQEEFAKHQEAQKSQRIAMIAAELQTLCQEAAKVGKSTIDMAHKVEPSDIAGIHELCYILVHPPGILQESGLHRYSFEIKIPLE
jgi:hypothetical protein